MKIIDLFEHNNENQISEDAESGVNTIKAWYDSKNDKIYELPLGIHHTEFLCRSDQISDRDFSKIYNGISKQEYINSYGQFGRFPAKFDENLLDSFYAAGWIRLGYDYDNRDKHFYANGNSLLSIRKGLAKFLKLFSFEGIPIKYDLFISDEKTGANYSFHSEKSFFNFIKKGSVKPELSVTTPAYESLIKPSVTLNENSIKVFVGNNLVHVMKNPSWREIQHALQKNINRNMTPHLRGYVDDAGDYYLWNAFDSIHGETIRSLGLEYNWENRCDITVHNEEYNHPFGVRFDCQFWEDVSKNKHIQTLVNNLGNIRLDLKESYVFDKTGKMVDKDFADQDIHGRCTNITLKAFGICTNDVVETHFDVSRRIKASGLKIIDFERLKFNYDSYKEAEDFKERHGRMPIAYILESPAEGNKFYNWNKLGPLLDKFKIGMSVSKFMQLYPSLNFVIGTSGHSMAIKDGLLYDWAALGPNKRRIVIADLILTPEEYETFLQDHPTFQASGTE